MRKIWNDIHPKQQAAIIMIGFALALSVALFSLVLKLSKGDMAATALSSTLLFVCMIASMIDRLRYAATIHKCPPAKNRPHINPSGKA